MTARPEETSRFRRDEASPRSIEVHTTDYLVASGMASVAGFQATNIVAAAAHADSPIEVVLAALFHWIVYLPLLLIWIGGVALISVPMWLAMRTAGLRGWPAPTLLGAGIVATIYVYGANDPRWTNTLYADNAMLAGVAGALAGGVAGLGAWLTLALRVRTDRRHVKRH